VAHAAGFARANTYAALEALLRRGATFRSAGRPARYRATDPTGLLVQLAAEQGERLDRLSRALAGIRPPPEPVTRALEGVRAIANVTQQLVARAEQGVDGVLAAELWQPTIPAWRRAATRATLHIRIAGDVVDSGELTFPRAPAEHPTVLLVDGLHTVLATRIEGGDSLAGLWSSNPLIAVVARLAIGET
jgi:sugar-specific transcriptional regulator TrmB